MRAGLRSLDKGRRAERDIVRRLNRWGFGWWRFGRRGLGHAGVADVVATADPGVLAWPFVVSVKAERGPTLRAVLERATAGRRWPWWEELLGAVPAEPERAWLVWRADGAWLLSCDFLWGAEVPPRVTVLPERLGWPRFTMLFDALLARVGPDDVARIAADWWERDRVGAPT